MGKGTLTELKDLNEFNDVLKSAEPVVADFSAVWCGPCKQLSTVLIDRAEKNPHFRFVKVDVDKFPSLATQFNVPTR